MGTSSKSPSTPFSIICLKSYSSFCVLGRLSWKFIFAERLGVKGSNMADMRRRQLTIRKIMILLRPVATISLDHGWLSCMYLLANDDISMAYLRLSLIYTCSMRLMYLMNME